ncbi:MAG: serine aminopeptidase domain-containing protein [Armatimonadota bacterium]
MPDPIPMPSERPGGRVATYVDPTHGTREDATFIPAGDGELFCVVHYPPGEARGGVVICPSIFAEEHKIYGTQVLAARSFAAAGFAVARFHYRGTGHSSGVVDDLTADTMLDDVATVVAYLRRWQAGGAPTFCGGRLGGLIAGLAAGAHPGAGLILWEPAGDGQQYFREIFRASQLSALAGGASALTVTQAVERVRTAGLLDTLGYAVHRVLYDSLDGRSLAQLSAAGPRPILLVQVSRNRELKHDYARLTAALTAAGSSVETALIEGEGAWAFVDSPMPSPERIAEVSLTWLTRTQSTPLS